MDQVAHIQCLDAVSKPQKDSITFAENGTFVSEYKCKSPNPFTACMYGLLEKIPFQAPFI
jgi:hypothetical protein